ncbi:YceI family protein [Pseudodesulfovibrio tunisiensis]|uniref:YceI family protein n=1 Tax=Pseudodesulfovibrio tunisiensis TaxID=463192 RepID=UPI001FB30435|nr:YceI family protein [Pseudodesulfovibrio tunisiensis]
MDINDLERLTLEQVREFAARRDGLLVDTLVPEHHAARHIPGAVNACVYEMVFLDTMDGLGAERDTPIVLYGAGEDSLDCFTAAEKLMRAGFTNLAVFPGGLEAWQQAGLPLEGTDPDGVEPPHPPLVTEHRPYRLVPGESVIRWTGRNHNGGHRGTLMFAEGVLEFGDEPSGSFIMDMTSIANEDLEGDELQPVLLDHLASDDFFFSRLFPRATFTVTRLKLALDAPTRPNAMMQGNLELRGISNEIAFPAHVRNVENGRIAVLGNLDFDRTQWGVIYGSGRFFQHLGYHVVYDFISLDFRMVLE